jgi:predicted DNA-binding protein with PD1-like motif
MKWKEFDSYIVVRLEKNEEILTALKETLQNTDIKGAFFYGLGVGEKLELGYFDAKEKQYIRKTFDDEYEFTNLIGNASTVDGELMIHCHVTITDNDFRAYGGHLFKGFVPATLEIVVFPFPTPLTRKEDEITGLRLLDL